jgi:hypothetical protein
VTTEILPFEPVKKKKNIQVQIVANAVGDRRLPYRNGEL